MSTVAEYYATRLQLVRNVRFDCVNEFDSEVPWGTVPTNSNGVICFRARIGIDTGLSSSNLFNMLAQITFKPGDKTVSFRFFRPPHTPMKKHGKPSELAVDAFTNVYLNMTFLDLNGKEVFSRPFTSSMGICGQNCTCRDFQLCHSVDSFCSLDTFKDAMVVMTLDTGVQFAHCYAIFDVQMEGRSTSSSRIMSLLQKPMALNSLAKTLKSLLEESTNSDVILRVGTSEFKAHTNILASHSEVFAAMFTCDMVEKQSRVVQIEDMEPNTMTVMLKYLYYRDLEEISADPHVAVKLVRAADKYNIQDLLKTCQTLITDSKCNKFSLPAALDCFLTGTQLNLPIIEEHAVDVLKTKGEEIKKSEDFKKFLEQHIDVVPRMFYLLTVKNDKKDELQHRTLF